MTILSCASSRPGNLGVSESGLAKCPSSPNCVCSEEARGIHFIEPLELKGDVARAWEVTRKVVAALPRTRLIEDTPSYLHAEVRSVLMHFVDDLELRLRPAERRIEIRSASRLGWSDMGVNRKRVETLRNLLVVEGVVSPSIGSRGDGSS